MLNEQILEILKRDGGWMSPGAIHNRVEGNYSYSNVTLYLRDLCKKSQVQEIHGVTGLEYALRGAPLPAGYQAPAPVKKVDPSTIKVDALDKPRAPAAPSRSAKPAAPAPRRMPAVPPTATAADKTTRQLVVELLDLSPTLTYKEVADRLQISEANAYYHLRALGHIQPKPTGAAVVHRADPQTEKAIDKAEQSKKPRIAKAGRGEMRARIEALLASDATLTNSQIAEQLGIEKSTVSYHRLRIGDASAPLPRAVLDKAMSVLADTAAQKAAQIERIKAAFTESALDAPAADAPATMASRFALWSTGELVIERPAHDAVVLSLDETRSLLAYLDRIVSLEHDVVSA